MIKYNYKYGRWSMNAKKFSILSIVAVLVFSIFMGCVVYYQKTTLALQNEQAMQDVENRHDDYDQSISDKVEEENNANSGNQESGAIVFNNFLDIFNNAISVMNTAPSFKASVDAGQGHIDAVANAHLPGYEKVSMPTNIEVKQIRDKNGVKLFRFFQYGETPDALKGIYDNAFYNHCIYKGGTYYVYQTKIASELNDQNELASKYTHYTRNSYMDKFASDADQFFYDINEDTIKSVVYFSKPSTPNGNYIAKVQLKDSAATRYNKLICSAALFETCKATNITLTFTFNNAGEFIKMEVEEDMTLLYKLEVAGLVSAKVDIVATNNYVMNFDFKYNGTVDTTSIKG